MIYTLNPPVFGSDLLFLQQTPTADPMRPRCSQARNLKGKAPPEERQSRAAFLHSLDLIPTSVSVIVPSHLLCLVISAPQNIRGKGSGDAWR